MSAAGPLLSVVIPVLNVEAYLQECLEGVLRCDLHDCEILLSVGCSSDRSNEICAEYAARFGFIRIVEQDGKGLSNARNCAMRVARGTYLLFLDSDDSCDSAMLDALIGRLRSGEYDADVVMTDFYQVRLPENLQYPVFLVGENVPDQRGLDFFKEKLRTRQCFWSVWRCFYRRSFLEEHGIRFAENSLCEDVDFTTRVFLAQPDAIFTHSPFYCYYVGRGGSLMDQPTFKRLHDSAEVLADSIARLRASSSRLAPEMIMQYQLSYLMYLPTALEVEPERRGEALALFQNHRALLSGSRSRSVRIAEGFLRVFGVSAAARMLLLLKYSRRFAKRVFQGKERVE